jgi:uncharacterized membrane protein
MRPDLMWVRVALTAFLAVAGIVIGIRLWRVDADGQRLLACVLFSVGAACMAIESVWSTRTALSRGLLTCALVSMLASAIVLYRANRRRRRHPDAR